MIVRVFRATAKEGHQSAFREFLTGTALPMLEETDGVESVILGEPFPSNPDEFLVITIWRDLQALKKFAGETWMTPVIDDEEKELLEDFTIHHYARVRRSVQAKE